MQLAILTPVTGDPSAPNQEGITTTKLTIPPERLLLGLVNDLHCRERMRRGWKLAESATILPLWTWCNTRRGIPCATPECTSSGTRRYLMVLPRTYASGMRQNLSPSCGAKEIGKLSMRPSLEVMVPQLHLNPRIPQTLPPWRCR